MRLGAPITIAAYIRDPVKFYLSSTQQGLKANSLLPLPTTHRPFRDILEMYERIGDEMTVRLHDRQALHGNDITRDFLAKVVGADAGLVAAIEPDDANVSFSAEAMDAMQKYRSLAPEENGRFTADSKAVVRLVREADRHFPGATAPRVHPHIAEQILASAVDAPWLRERWGIAFEGFDYDAAPRGDLAVARPVRVRDICPVNEDRTTDILCYALRDLAKDREVEVSFKTAMPVARPKPEPAGTAAKPRGAKRRLKGWVRRLIRR